MREHDKEDKRVEESARVFMTVCMCMREREKKEKRREDKRRALL